VSVSPQPRRFKRRYLLVGLGIFVLLLAFVLFSQTSLNLSFIQPESTSEAILLAAFSALIFLLFVALTFVLARNLLKVFAERKVGVLGSRFRARMVIGALLLSFLPTIFLFLFSYVLMNRSIEKWFSRPVEQLSQDTSKIADQVTAFARDNAIAKARWLVASAPVRDAVLAKDMAAFDAALIRHADSMQGATVVVRENGSPIHAWANGRAFVPGSQVLNEKAGSVTGRAAVRPGLAIDVILPLPPQFSASLQSVESSQKGYAQLKLQQKQLRSFYMRLLLLLTVLTLFAATWISLFLARLVTRPVAALAEATQQIGAGHLGYRVEVAAADELAGLVASFNQMAMELESSRQRIESAGRELADANVALAHANTDLERRSTEISTILENIPTGVLSLDGEEKVTHSNRAFKDLFRKSRTEFGEPLEQVLEATLAEDVRRLLRRADRMGTAAREMESGGMHLEVTAASLGARKRSGYVVVFENLSELLKAQKQAAWREVARRVAHEIKNPLTPILLSAERMRKHLNRGPVPDPGSVAVIQGSVETISGAVDTLRRLVDEFSTLARFPAAQPVPIDLNEVVNKAIAMFNGRLDGINLRTSFATTLPKIMADPDGLQRVVANLVDNAAEAMQDSLLKEIEIRTAVVESDSEMVEISVSDTGHGITADLKERLFLPYFSTKDRGTGLGLAIVSRVIEEHHGSIRVEENQPLGARFIVELPVHPHA
jgi:two-component system, NtrC family, nitrogen regulation sensor histidine kinase NtrY